MPKRRCLSLQKNSQMNSLIAWLIRNVPRKYLQRVSGKALQAAGAVWYRGHGVHCPVCDGEYRVFMPYGRLSSRANALCPGCMSLERHRLIWLYLQTTNFFSPLQVLHIAPEPCFIKKFESIHGQGYVTADLESPLAKVKMDIHRMPFSENQFDVVLCNHVLEHVADDKQAMREILRVLKPRGWAVLQVPFFPPLPDETFEDKNIVSPRDREKAFGQEDHVRKYGKDYVRRLTDCGFQAEVNFTAKTLSKEEAFRCGILQEEELHIARKKPA